LVAFFETEARCDKFGLDKSLAHARAFGEEKLKMNVKGVLAAVSDSMKTELFTVGNAVISPASLLVFLAVLFGAYIVSKAARRGIRRFFAKKDVKTKADAYVLQRIVHYIIMLVGTVGALQTVGIDLSTLFAAGAVFAVGIGIAMQNISQNFVSGVILLLERTIKQGDIIEVNDMVVRVERIGIRAALVRTRNEEELIVPNAILVQSVVKNFTLSDASYLIGAQVGVSYESDMRQVRAVLESVAENILWRDMNRPTRVLLTEFGDSAVIFSVYVFIQDPWASRRMSSDLNEAIWWGLKDAGITIAFPQLDVHFDTAARPTFLGGPSSPGNTQGMSRA
jgi:small-conductance mechanosensitive channel